MENNNERFPKIKQEEKENTKINVVSKQILKLKSKKQFKKSKKQGKNIIRYYQINLVIKILFIRLLFIIELAMEIKRKNLLPIERKKKLLP